MILYPFAASFEAETVTRTERVRTAKNFVIYINSLGYQDAAERMKNP